MRTSKRESILRTAISLIDASGTEALSYDSLAAATGLSKSGLIYHFPSRHDLMLGMHTLLAQDWDDELVEVAGGRAEDVDPTTRLRAVVITLTENVARAELLLLMDAPSHPDFTNVWREVNQRWMPSAEGVEDNALARSIYLIQLAADGLFVHDHIHDTALTTAQRNAMLEALLELIPGQD